MTIKKILSLRTDTEISWGMAIFSYDSATKILWHLTKLHNFDFERIRDFELAHLNNSLHAVYYHFAQNYDSNLFFLKNKGSNGYIISSKIEIQYLLLAKDGASNLLLEPISDYLKNIKNIMAINPLEPKNYNKLAPYLSDYV